MLQFDGKWRFDSPGPIEPAAQEGFHDLINRISGQGQRKVILEPGQMESFVCGDTIR